MMFPSRYCVALSIIAAVLIFGTITVSAKVTSLETTFEVNRAQRAKLYCKGEYTNKNITQAEFKALLKKHQSWLREFDATERRESDVAKNDSRRANLCGAILQGLDLSKADLSGANLSEADLRYQESKWVHLYGANLSGANLVGVNFSGFFMDGVNLSGADLSLADLTETKLVRADLSGAILRETDLSGALFAFTNMSGVVFEPKILPRIDYIAFSMNLDRMHYYLNPQALVKLRHAFYESGYREPERAITNAIKRSEMLWDDTLWGDVESVFKVTFFELPTQWGMYPGRALRLLVLMIVIFSPSYILTLRFPGSGHEHIYRMWGSNNKPIASTKRRRSKHRATPMTPGRTELLHLNWTQAILTGIQFSILSAFNIGFRELNVGNWITRLQTRDYTLYATGWTRSFAGFQSLISVYLLAMWALTYFGRPFG